MIIFPAIDIRNGKCVRLEQGRFDKEDIYGEDPIEVALGWEKKGARYLHLVDLDGALHGTGVNRRIVKEITAAVKIPVQLGGGIRTLTDINNVLDIGVSRVILGTAAVNQEGFVKLALDQFKDKIAVSIDAKNGLVAIDGWTKTSEIKAADFAKQLETFGLTTLIYTDIAKDGMLSGPNFTELAALKETVDIDIIASGGISSKEDVNKLNSLDFYGAIIGKALYTGKINLVEL